MTELQARWQGVLQEVVDRAAHEVRDALNGVAVNLEVVRSRSAAGMASAAAVAPFAEAAADQLETLGGRIESFLFLSRPPRPPTDIALTVRHLGQLLVPATRADGGTLSIEGAKTPALTSTDAVAVRLALASGLLLVTEPGKAGRCVLEADADTVVRFSHEPAGARTLDPVTAALLAGQSIRVERSAEDLILVFPGNF